MRLRYLFDFEVGGDNSIKAIGELVNFVYV